MSSGQALAEMRDPATRGVASSYQNLLTIAQTVLDAIPAGVYVCSANGVVVRFNRTAATLWGRTPDAGDTEERFCGAFRLYQLDGTYLPHAETPMATVLMTGEPARDKEVIVERPDGSRVFVLVNIEPLKDASGRLQGAINCFQDITTRKLAESAVDTRAHRLSTLNRIARTLSSDMDLEHIVQAVTDSATDLTQAKFGAFFYNVTDSAGERYLLYTLSGVPREAFERFGVPRNTALFGPTFRGEAPVRCDDVRKDPRYGLSGPHHGMPKGHLPVVSYLAVPVVSRSGEVHGGLFFAHDRPGVFTAEAEELAVGIAAHAAIAIDNAHLLQAAAQRATQQTALYEFTDQLQRAETLSDICDAALEAILNAAKCDRASILQLDGDGVMRFVASRGLSERYRKAVEGHSPWPANAQNPKPVCIHDTAAADLDAELISVVKAEGIRALAFFPLVANRRLIGKFMTYYSAPHTFTSEDIDVSLTIARQLAFSLERLRMEQARRLAETQLQAREAELETIINRTPFLLARCSRDFTYRLASHAYANMVRRRPEDIAGRPIVEVLGSQAFAGISPHVEKVLRGETVEYRSELQIEGVGSRFIHAVYLPDQDEQGHVQGWIESIRDITDQKRAESQRDILAAELSHRVKNTLATMQAIAAQSLRGANVSSDARDRFEGRLLSLSEAHNILARNNWEGGDLAEVITRTLRRHGAEGRFSVEGPPIGLSPNAVLAISMATHELVVNAAKYGALSNEKGQVSITWQIDPSGPLALTLQWKEIGGPAVNAPQRRGFGSRLIERNLAADLQGEVKLDYRPEGVVCTITTRIEAINPRRNLEQRTDQ